MKKLILLAASFMIVLSGCGKEENTPSTVPLGAEKQVQEPAKQIEEPEREAVFKNEDIDQAKKMAQQYVAVLTEFHGRKAHTTSDIEGLQREMSEKIKSAISIHKDSRIYQESGTRRNEANNLDLSASRFELFLEEAKEVYYPNLTVSELIIPMTYIIPGKNSSGDPKTYKLHFVKNNNNQIQLIDGFFVGGPDLEKKDQEEVDPYNAEKLKNDLKIQ
ncbi:hypothetical protein J45TS6_35880 [Paenibacillus sp. J45TS6]|uniref:hypothetical protein n=1 Tax=Paenibacillus sp. J45TS6 TaxID=2807196 RepID=UPI001AFE6EB8|nr:hypothetical protein [Paenibacillus sp. J45TS6]GIP45129.1 hypothetical protein J45TS6_35880 [Paenibacillus sp. J45TS6]